MMQSARSSEKQGALQQGRLVKMQGGQLAGGASHRRLHDGACHCGSEQERNAHCRYVESANVILCCVQLLEMN